MGKIIATKLHSVLSDEPKQLFLQTDGSISALRKKGSKLLKKRTQNTLPIIRDKEQTYEYYQKIFLEGKRLGMTPRETKEFLRKKGIAVINQLNFLKSQKSLNDYTIDELIKWRDTARYRIMGYNDELKAINIQIEEILSRFLINKNRIDKKRLSDIQWFKSIGKVLSQKIQGIHFTDDHLIMDKEDDICV